MKNPTDDTERVYQAFQLENKVRALIEEATVPILTEIVTQKRSIKTIQDDMKAFKVRDDGL